jgi:hypothetical protein
VAIASLKYLRQKIDPTAAGNWKRTMEQNFAKIDSKNN